MGVEASVIITFVDGSEEDVDGTISVEIDEEHPNNLNDDGEVKSSFYPDDQPVFIIHYDYNKIEIADILCTDGRIEKLNTKSFVRERSLDALFPKIDDEVSLSYSAIADLEETWYGNIGDVRIDHSKQVLFLIGGEMPCYGKFTYNVIFEEQWQLTPPSLELDENETYTIYVVIYIRKIPAIVRSST